MFDWLKGKKKQITALAKAMDINQLRKRAKIVVIDDDKNAFPTKALQTEGFTYVPTLPRSEYPSISRHSQHWKRRGELGEEGAGRHSGL